MDSLNVYIGHPSNKATKMEDKGAVAPLATACGKAQEENRTYKKQQMGRRRGGSPTCNSLRQTKGRKYNIHETTEGKTNER